MNDVHAGGASRRPLRLWPGVAALALLLSGTASARWVTVLRKCSERSSERDAGTFFVEEARGIGEHALLGRKLAEGPRPP